jgi:hypothetical protein
LILGLVTYQMQPGHADRNSELDLRIRECLDRAAACERRAAQARDLAARTEFEQAATTWLELAVDFARLKRLTPPG